MHDWRRIAQNRGECGRLTNEAKASQRERERERETDREMKHQQYKKDQRKGKEDLDPSVPLARRFNSYLSCPSTVYSMSPKLTFVLCPFYTQ